MRWGALVVMTCSACRIGAYTGSTRGVGTATPTTMGASERDASLSMGNHETTYDHVFRGRYVVMTTAGGGSYRVRSREMSSLHEDDSQLDFHVGAGAGYQVYRTDYVAVVPYISAATGLFSFGEDYTDVGTRFTAGVEVNALFTKPEGSWRGGVAARLGYCATSGRLVEDDGAGGSTRHDLSFDGISLQVGVILDVDPYR